jgi:hypothetical protein
MSDSDDDIFLRKGRIEYVEPRRRSTSVQDEEDTDVSLADHIYTREWTSVSSDAMAYAFVARLLKDATPNEELYIANIYFGRDNTGTAKAIIDDKIRDVEARLREIDESRATELGPYERSLGTRDAEDAHLAPMLEALKRAMSGATEEELKLISDRQIATVGGAEAGCAPMTAETETKLMQYADSVHDFDPEPPVPGKTVVPQACIKTAIGVDLPEDLTDDCVKDKFKFTEYMISKPGTSVHGKNILHQFNLSRANQILVGYDLWELFRVQERLTDMRNGLLSVDVWSPRHETERRRSASGKKKPLYKDTVYMAQITALCARIKGYFGHGKLTFIVDASDDQMTRMAIATSFLDPAIGRRFAMYENVDLGRVATTNREKAKTDWSYMICDANIVDGPSHIQDLDYDAPKLSKRPTGTVPGQTAVQFLGIFGPANSPSATYKVGDDVAKPCHHSQAPFSSEVMAGAMLERLRTSTDINEYLCCKRACDWGQVQHCLEYDAPDNKHIFVTSDVLATLYGVHKSANVLSLNRNNTSVSLPEATDILQSTFTMFRPDQVQEGGNAGTMVRLALLAFVFLMSIVP